MSIIEQLDELDQLENLEKEAALIPNLRNVGKAMGGTVKKFPTAAAEKPVESYGKGAVSAGPGFKSSVSSVPTEGPRSVKTSFTQGSKAPVPSKSVEPSFNSSQTQVGKGFSGTIKTNPVQPGPTSLNHSFTQSSKPAAPATAPSGVDRSGMTVSQAKPEEAYRRSLGERFSTSWKNFKQNMTGNTLEKRRASAEEFHNNQQSNLVGTYKKTDTPAAPVNEKDIDRSNMQVRQKDQPAPEDNKPKWYKNKEVMKGVGIGVAGAAGVGLAAHALSNRNNQQNNGPQGYY